MLCRLLSLPPIFVLLLSLVPPAALPPLPIVEEVVPLGLVEVPPVPSVEAEVPPTAALPAVPPVAADPDGPDEAPPLPAVEALCARAAVAHVAITPAMRTVLKFFIEDSLLFLILDVGGAAVPRAHR